jgi:hypothetical protein
MRRNGLQQLDRSLLLRCDFVTRAAESVRHFLLVPVFFQVLNKTSYIRNRILYERGLAILSMASRLAQGYIHSFISGYWGPFDPKINPLKTKRIVLRAQCVPHSKRSASRL